MLTKKELDQRVALAIGVPADKVAKFTDAFVDELCNAIAHHGGFHLAGLGKLVPKIERGGGGSLLHDNSQDSMRVRLYFTKSPLLKEQIDRQFGLKESSYEQE